ncbi:MAG: asparaginase [Candidatus Magasanikbacteria bacterium RIFCSPHIGHO2_01_FULL_41_23]|uniref:Asparaginase n=1 Tax=Candidatus Magasanikbacteria bacterium RIFCSPLOWO2_01_FULL_40_15 TaxID=1798686 RepID=A0A1F6N0Y8_9BACT|nr:MAG: asparaginase [Candidatus Magasanikbacteria bacterium RIFCSPHIGHO2_01_FULL_41_23]OGH74724.1 MAG: asparaginase [Candidatus Magasanikbacteria bacterium RIFCSPHIGHO2_12_FULL_41_16]OGH77438.1 MAG: asparaginase [Candidatus Magasanikbacteria bacterium RIFCSPLOWO2_01_FULL_40_15]
MKIRLFVTGGTFDKEYNELTGELFFKDTHLPEILKAARSEADVEITTLMLIDSLLMTDAHRQIILENCQNAVEDRIVITHGTDTMVQTAQVLAGGIKNKTIVLTGSMLPFRFGNSDALFNIGCAFGLAQALAPGIYIAMNGKYFFWNNVQKNKIIGKFEELV